MDRGGTFLGTITISPATPSGVVRMLSRLVSAPTGNAA